MSSRRGCFGAVLGAILMAAVPAQAVDVNIRAGATFAGVLDAVRPGYEAATGDKLHVVTGDAPADVVMGQRAQLDTQLKEGKMDAAALTDFGRARVGYAVKAGTSAPDISTPEKLKAVVLAAKSVSLSRFASGIYVSGTVFPKLGVADEMKPKIVPATGLVAEAVAQGTAEVGFQQMYELLPVKGVIVVGRIPDSLQTVTTVTAGIPKDAKSPEAARRFAAYLASPAAAAALKTMDLDPAK